MKFHIVRNGETVDDIMFLYSLNHDELIEKNRHIRSWNKLVPGTKLKIPVVSEEIDQEVISMEPFIEDYYPKINNQINEFNSQIKNDDNKSADSKTSTTDMQQLNPESITKENIQIQTVPEQPINFDNREIKETESKQIEKTENTQIEKAENKQNDDTEKQPIIKNNNSYLSKEEKSFPRQNIYIYYPYYPPMFYQYQPIVFYPVPRYKK